MTRRCTAKARTTGNRCRNPPIEGGSVCRMHGGSAPQVKRSARLRLLELVDPAIAQLARIMAGAMPEARPSDVLRAVENVLDRTGHPRRTEIDVDQARQDVLERVAELRRNGEVQADGR